MSANIDSQELDKFASRADQWWNTDGAFRTLHDINPLRLKYVESCCTIKGKTVLDIGCGGGILSESMAKKDAIVTAIDASMENIECAVNHGRQTGVTIDYQCTTAEDFAETHANAFDVVTCMELLEHVPDPASLISACAKLVKPGGHVIFSTINRNPKSYLLAVLGAEYLLGLLPRGTHDYEKFIRPAELVRWCKAHNLMLNDIRGMNYNPLTKHCRLIDKPDINYLVDTIAVDSNS